MIRPHRSRDHWHQEWLSDVEEAVERDIDDTAPLVSTHARHDGVIVDAGIVYQNIDGASGKHTSQRRPGRLRVGDVERDGSCRTTGCDDVRGNPLGPIGAAIGMHVDMPA